MFRLSQTEDNSAPWAQHTPQRSMTSLILVDATYSMGTYLDSLNQSLPQIISISALTNCFEKIGVLEYRDYNMGKAPDNLLEWSGWASPGSSAEGDVDLIDIGSKLRYDGGSDIPEATKTGLAKVHQVMREGVITLILLYADAPPHMLGDQQSTNYGIEQKALKNPKRFGGSGPLFADWVSGAQTLRSGAKRAHVMCLLRNMNFTKTGCFEYLSHMTSGACMFVTRPTTRSISEITVEILLAWMGVKKEGTADVSLPADISRYNNVHGILDVRREEDENAKRFWSADWGKKRTVSISQRALSTKTLETHLPKKATPLQDFAKTYKTDSKYRSLVTTHLRQIIERDVAAVSLNPVFGSLWRAVCTDRENDHRQGLLDLFGKKVDDMKNADERAKMKIWLEESYDYIAEVLETINTVPQQLRFPCVFLDPTLAFVRGAKETEKLMRTKGPSQNFVEMSC